MSKMKHLLRKLHIGGGINDHHHRLPETAPTAANQSPSPNLSSTSNDRIAAVESTGGDRTTTVVGVGNGTSGGVDFNLLEEEFQVQLALAISASDPDAREDPESAQIDAAKRISLGCSMAARVADTDSLLDSLSLRYWSYSVVNYNEKVVDGFYDVYGITSNVVVGGKMPLLADLQAISISDNVEHEVILVNRLTDPELQELEKSAYLTFMGSQASDDLIQKIAGIVVDRMGGPVGDPEGMTGMWIKRSCELRTALNTVILPLGCLDVGLSRHRALLFKVLADRINLPCMLVKGSYYTGTDDGAVNFIKIADGSEFIIDLMGAPGALIPAEVPSSHLSTAAFDLRGFTSLTESAGGSSLLMAGEPGTLAVSPKLGKVSHVGSSRSEEMSFLGIETSKRDANLVEKDQAERFEHEFGKLLQSSNKSFGSSSAPGQLSSAQNIKVKNVSEYVISAAKNPDFAQKLHAVLLESGASPPPDLFSDINSQDLGKQNMHEQVHQANGVSLVDNLQYHSDKFLPRCEQSLLPLNGEESSNDVRCNYEKAERPAELQRGLEKEVLNSEVSYPPDQTCDGFVLVDDRTNENLQLNASGVDAVPVNPPQMPERSMHKNQIFEPSVPSASGFCRLQPENTLHGDDGQSFQLETGNMEMVKEFDVELMETAISSLRVDCNGYSKSIKPMLGEVAEWEIPWEDLQIGERIGIGSYGEVYHADWNGTEIAVKKFLDQDLSGDALVQYKCEAEIMIRLRHPNVVLFMGAVTRPPHLSILTEFLPRGSLYRLLHRSGHQLDEKRRMRMALDVAKGMNYLHQSHPTIVHRDLKSPNLLVDKNWVVKVCDFGLSRMKHHTFLSSKSTAGTPEWMAPEVLRNERANEKCDVYSFGVILWELATCQIPWKGLNPMQVVGAIGFQNRRLEIPEDVDSAVAGIIHDCWQSEPHFRPSFSQLISRLRRVQQLCVERRSHISPTD